MSLSPEQQAVLDELATRKSVNYWQPVSGIDLRKVAAGSTLDEKQKVVESLCPEFAEKGGERPNDHYAITLKGLLASSQGDAARHWVSLILQLLHAKLDEEGAFHDFTWRELGELGGSGDAKPPGLVEAVLALGNLLNVKIGDGHWVRPEDIELLRDVNDVDQLVALRKKQADDAAQLAEDKLNVNVLARRVLGIFGQFYEQLGRRNFSLIPGNPAFDATKLSMKGRVKGFERLLDLELLKSSGTNWHAMLTADGVSMLANPGLLDEVLPVTGKRAVATMTRHSHRCISALMVSAGGSGAPTFRPTV